MMNSVSLSGEKSMVRKFTIKLSAMRLPTVSKHPPPPLLLGALDFDAKVTSNGSTA